MELSVLAPDGSEPDWPDGDVVIGNPPFLGGKLLIGGLGEKYVSGMFAVWKGVYRRRPISSATGS